MVAGLPFIGKLVGSAAALPAVRPPGPLPAGVLPDMQLGPGVYDLTGDTTVAGQLYARGGGGVTRIRLNGHRFVWDTSTCTVDIQGTPKTGGRWSEGGSAYVAGQQAVIAPVAPGAVKATDLANYVGGPVGSRTWIDAGRSVTKQAEVVNLDADIVFEGPGDIHISPEGHTGGRAAGLGPAVTLKWVRCEKMGIAGALGFYPLHFHLCGETSRGSVIEGVVAYQSTNHAFVTHSSNGVTWRDCAAVDTIDIPFWWDEQSQPANHDLRYEHCIALLARPRALKPGESAIGPGYRFCGFRLSGGYDWHLGSKGDAGTNLAAVGCTAVLILGGVQHSGFLWPEADGTVWTFQGCTAHNIPGDGIFVWQNEGSSHDVDDFVAYNCGNGVEHGAYLNRFQFHRLFTADCNKGVALHAMTGQNGPLPLRDMVFEHRHLGQGVPMSLEKPTLKGTPTVVKGANYGPSQVAVVNQSAIPGGVKNTVALRLVFRA